MMGGLAMMAVTPARAATCAGETSFGCGFTITIGPGGSVAGVNTGLGPYDGSDDTLIGVFNHSSTPLTSLHISGSSDIFGFDGDGIDTYPGSVGNSTDTTGYGGPDAYFTNIAVGAMSGTVDFITPIGLNGSTYFSLEEPPSAITIGSITTGVPEPASVAILSSALLGLGMLRRRRKQ